MPDQGEAESGSTDDSTAGQGVTKQLCSFAVTGPAEAYQAIYVCQTCCGSKENLCICQACAEFCHADHEVVHYIAMGPSYCDCRAVGCQIASESDDAAARCGTIVPSSTTGHCPAPIAEPNHGADYILDVYRLPVLEDISFRDALVAQATDLVNHSRDTFWIDDTIVEDQEQSLCLLEAFAWKIFLRHREKYRIPGSNSSTPAGAEWWVQVKPVTLPPKVPVPAVDGKRETLENYANGAEAVDLHYDKDEVMAETFGLGYFPVLSTVTYLTALSCAPPTLVFLRRYDEADDQPISSMLVSRPSRSKHLVFDGRLLHGAPSHFALRPHGSDYRATDGVHDDDKFETLLRVTFLVNVWSNHKPLGVSVLPEPIRDALSGRGVESLGRFKSLSENVIDIEFQGPVSVPKIMLSDADQLPVALQTPIELPFVGGLSTWGDGDEEEDAMVLVTYPPPSHSNDSFLVQFGPDLESYLA
jgi:hypothetical protein